MESHVYKVKDANCVQLITKQLKERIGSKV